MFCLKCGQKIDDNATYCPYCNAATENADTSTETTQPTKSQKKIQKKYQLFSVLSE